MPKSVALLVLFVVLGLTACVDKSAAVGGFGTPVQQIALGHESACVRDASNELWCWGASGIFPGVPVAAGPGVDCVSPFVELGGGGGFGTCVAPGPLPVDLGVSGNLVDVVVSNRGYALTSEDEIYVWPVRIDGCVGGQECTEARRAASGLGITDLVAYQGGWCGLTAVGTGYCQYLLANDSTHPTPDPIPGGHVIKALATAGATYFVLDDTGHLWQGSFRRDTSASSEHYVPATALPWLPDETFTAVSLSNRFAAFDTPPANIPGCAVSTTGAVWCWGWNDLGQHGDGTFGPISGGVPVPSKVLLPAPAAEVSVGLLHTCARSEDGRVFCWGSNFIGELGYTPSSTCSLPGLTIGCSATPAEVTSLPPSRRLHVSSHYSCAEAMDGSIRCWGTNASAQCGRARVSGSPPVRVDR